MPGFYATISSCFYTGLCSQLAGNSNIYSWKTLSVPLVESLALKLFKTGGLILLSVLIYISCREEESYLHQWKGRTWSSETILWEDRGRYDSKKGKKAGVSKKSFFGIPPSACSMFCVYLLACRVTTFWSTLMAKCIKVGFQNWVNNSWNSGHFYKEWLTIFQNFITFLLFKALLSRNVRKVENFSVTFKHTIKCI